MERADGDETGRQQIVRERRQLTIVFCDLVASTDLSARVDPEDFASLILEFQEAGQRVFTNYGGYVAQFLGDGLLVCFGYPRAFENDAERSVRASLELLEEMDQISASGEARLSARVGIHSGLAVVGESQHAGRSAIFGETVNVAARVQSAASPGTVYVSPATLALLKERFTTRDIGPTHLKGIDEPMRLYRIVRRSTASAETVRIREKSSLFGRETQLARLGELWRRTASGERTAAVILAEPGMGKSSLIHAFRSSLEATPHTWLEAQCDPLAGGSPFHPFVSLIRRSIGVSEGVEEAEGVQRLQRALASLAEPLEDALPFVARLLDFKGESVASLASESPEIVRQRTLDALVGWVERIAAVRPVILVCEDLHWSDATTVELLDRLVKRREQVRLLCLATTRLGSSRAWMNAFPEKIELDALDAADSEHLARLAAAPTELPSQALSEIMDRAGGNPLFIEELARFAGEAGGETIGGTSVPPSLDGLVMERLDRLEPSARIIAQLASLLGREFDASYLAAVSSVASEALESAVDTLLAADILRVQSRQAATYVFRHALTQDAAAATLLRPERERIHARAADCLRTAFAGRAEAQPDLVAHHLLESRQHREAAQWFLRAGRMAAQRAAVEDAVTLYRRGLDALERAKPDETSAPLELSLQILLGNALMGVRGFGSTEIVPVWERALALAEHLGDQDEASSALNGLAAYHLGAGNCRKAIELANRILESGDPGEDRIGRLRAHSSIATALFQMGDSAGALDHAERAIEVYQPSDFATVTYGVGTDQGVIAYAAAASAHWWLGRSETALELAERGVSLAQTLESALSLAAARSLLILTLHFRGDAERAHAEANENIAFCENLNFPFWLGFCRMIRGGQPIDAGEKRLEDVIAGLACLAETGSRSAVGVGFSIMATAQHAAGASEPALATLDSGLQMCAALEQHFWDAELIRLKGEILRDADRLDEAEPILRTALKEAEDRGARSLCLRSSLSLTRLLRSTGRDAEAVAIVAECYDGLDERGSTPDVKVAEVLLRGDTTF